MTKTTPAITNSAPSAKSDSPKKAYEAPRVTRKKALTKATLFTAGPSLI